MLDQSCDRPKAKKFSKSPQAEENLNPIRTGGGLFSTRLRGFCANNFGSNKGTQSKLSDFS